MIKLAGGLGHRQVGLGYLQLSGLRRQQIRKRTDFELFELVEVEDFSGNEEDNGEV